MDEIEKWKDIIKYTKMDGESFLFENGKYMVSNFGRVISYNKIDNPIFLKEHLTNTGNGYKQIQIFLYDINKKRRILTLSRLVAQYFCYNDDPKNKKFVNHKDESPSSYSNLKINTRADNLEWCTKEYNATYGTATKRCVEKNIKNGSYKKQSDLYSKTVGQFSMETGELIKIWKSTKEIERNLGLSNSGISACCRNYRNCKTMYGYVWRYIDEYK